MVPPCQSLRPNGEMVPSDICMSSPSCRSDGLPAPEFADADIKVMKGLSTLATICWTKDSACIVPKDRPKR